MTEIEQNERWRSALHESAHAVVALALGGRVRLALLDDEGGGACWPTFEGADEGAEKHPDRWARETAIVAAAGLGDVEQWFPDSPRVIDPLPTTQRAIASADFNSDELFAVEVLGDREKTRACSTDRAKMVAFATNTLDLDQWASRARSVMLSAQRLCALHLPAIERVAVALYRRGALTEAQINGLFAPAAPVGRGGTGFAAS